MAVQLQGTAVSTVAYICVVSFFLCELGKYCVICIIFVQPLLTVESWQPSKASRFRGRGPIGLLTPSQQSGGSFQGRANLHLIGEILFFPGEKPHMYSHFELSYLLPIRFIDQDQIILPRHTSSSSVGYVFSMRRKTANWTEFMICFRGSSHTYPSLIIAHLACDIGYTMRYKTF